jgi:hypothetical protein
MAENPVATCAANGTTIYGSHGVSSVTASSTGHYIFNFDSTTQGYRTTSWDACNISIVCFRDTITIKQVIKRE